MSITRRRSHRGKASEKLKKRNSDRHLRKSPRLKRVEKIVQTSCKAVVETSSSSQETAQRENVQKKTRHSRKRSSSNKAKVSPTVCASKAAVQYTRQKSSGGVYDFEFVNGEDWTLKQELSPKKTTPSDRKEALAQNALKNLRQEVTQKTKRTKTRARKLRPSPQSEPSNRTKSLKRNRKKTDMVSHSTQTPPKKRRCLSQNATRTKTSQTSSLKENTNKHTPSSVVSGAAFMSPPSFSASLMKKTSTSTPSDPTLTTPNIILRPRNVEHNESLYEEQCILVGAPDLSPVGTASAIYESDAEETGQEPDNLITPEYVEVERSIMPAEDELEEEDIGYRTLSISKTYANRSFSNRSFVGMFDIAPEPSPKPKKRTKKRKPKRQSTSRIDVWADKMNTEFEELENYELSVD